MTMWTHLDVASMGAPAENILGLQDAEKYGCRVWHYDKGHSVMTIYVQKEAPTGMDADHFFIVFEVVQYFEGPMSWKGANFGIGTLEECANLLVRLQSRHKL